MAQLLQHQESAFYGKELHGCRWSILQFFGFRRHLRNTKMLSDKKHGQGKRSGGNRRRRSYAPLENEDSGIVNDEKNTEVTKKQKASNKNSGKASLRSLIRRKLYGKEGLKEKMLPVAPKLLRTISIHYLESNEYVLDSGTTSSGDGSSHSTTLPMQNANNINLHHDACDTADGGDSDTSSLLLSKRGDSHVKRKSHRSISMDGVLHKVPYGKKVSGDVISEELPRSASATYDRDGLKPYFGTAAKRHVNQGFRRSRSLTESLENYSRLLDSIASSESRRMLTSSKSTRDRSLDGPSVMNSLQSTSNAELRSQGLVIHEENLVTLEDALASHVPEETDVDGDVNVAVDESFSNEIAGASGNISLFEEYIRDRKCDVAVSTEADSCTAPSPSEVVYISEKQAATCGDNDQAFSSTEVDLCDARSMPEVDILEEHAETCDDDQIPSSIQADSFPRKKLQADSCTALTSEDTNIAEEHTTTSHDNQMHSFQISKPIEDTSLKPRIIHLNDADVSNAIDVVQESDSDNLNGLQVDPAHEVEFNYVKDIFKKSSFSNEMLFDEWYSQNIAALQEDDCQHYEAAAAAFDFTDMSADQLLLFDLTNHALLDIYKKYSDKSKLSWFSSFDRPKPVGHLVLKELWSKVSCRLDAQPRSGIEVDTILSCDLAKSDRWMDFQRDVDHLGNKLADLVFDKLVTDLILQLAEF